MLLLCYHNNLIIKNYIRHNSCLDERWLFTDRIKVGSVPQVIDKGGLAQFIYKPA